MEIEYLIMLAVAIIILTVLIAVFVRRMKKSSALKKETRNLLIGLGVLIGIAMFVDWADGVDWEQVGSTVSGIIISPFVWELYT